LTVRGSHSGPQTAILVHRFGLGPLAEAATGSAGQAKAQKNLGDLNRFIRDNTLDIPATFDTAKTMIEVFARSTRHSIRPNGPTSSGSSARSPGR
jgi:uncharacterized protein YPO0396